MDETTMEEYLEFVKFLNGGEPLDTFEVGSVKIDPIIWPKVARKTEVREKKKSITEIQEQYRNNSIPSSLLTDGSERKPQEVQTENERKKRRIQVTEFNKPQPPAQEKKLPQKKEVCSQLKDLSSFVQELLGLDHNPKNFPDHQVKKKDGKHQVQEKRKIVAKIQKEYNSSSTPSSTRADGLKKKKLRIDQIENEQKKRRIQVIEFQKPKPPAQEKKLPLKERQSKRLDKLFVQATGLPWHHQNMHY